METPPTLLMEVFEMEKLIGRYPLPPNAEPTGKEVHPPVEGRTGNGQ